MQETKITLHPFARGRGFKNKCSVCGRGIQSKTAKRSGMCQHCWIRYLGSHVNEYRYLKNRIKEAFLNVE